MNVEIAPPCPSERFGEERIAYKLSSVAVWVIVSTDKHPKYSLAVQQADKLGFPWGIPAGRESDADQDFTSVGIREVREETGLELQRDELRYLKWGWKQYGAEKGYLIYTATVDITRVRGNRVQSLDDGTILYDPPVGVSRLEVRSLALIPLSLAFCKNILNANPYHPRETYKGLAALRQVGFVKGNFGFEDDPGL